MTRQWFDQQKKLTASYLRYLKRGLLFRGDPSSPDILRAAARGISAAYCEDWGRIREHELDEVLLSDMASLEKQAVRASRRSVAVGALPLGLVLILIATPVLSFATAGPLLGVTGSIAFVTLIGAIDANARENIKTGATESILKALPGQSP
jgi:hypothetical protein